MAFSGKMSFRTVFPWELPVVLTLVLPHIFLGKGAARKLGLWIESSDKNEVMEIGNALKSFLLTEGTLIDLFANFCF